MMKSSTPAQTALKKLLLKEFHVLEKNENNINGENKTEGLHKFRIAVRKTRSLLRQTGSVLPEKTILKFNHEFKYLAQKTCKSRDLDVFLRTLEEFRLSMHDIPPDLYKKIYEYIYSEKINEEQELLDYLHSTKFSRLKNDWIKALNKPLEKNSSLKNADMPIDYVLINGINTLYRKMLEQGDNINVNSPYQDYHDLRKTCKKLRYLLEYFHDFHPGKTIKSVIKKLKNVQDVLGDLQDKRIQIDMLNNFIEIKKQPEDLSDESVKLVKLLINKLDEQCLVVKTGFPKIYHELSEKLGKEINGNIIRYNKITKDCMLSD